MFRKLLPVALLVVAATTVLACHEPSPAQGPAVQHAASFVPELHVTDARLVTERAIKVTEADDAQLAKVGARKLGVLRIDRRLPPEDRGSEAAIWTGAAGDAASLGATHARILTVEGWTDSETGVNDIKVRYVIWHVDVARWSELPDTLKPKPLPASIEPANIAWAKPKAKILEPGY